MEFQADLTTESSSPRVDGTTPGPASHAVVAIAGGAQFLMIFWSLQIMAMMPDVRFTWRGVIGIVSASLLAGLVHHYRARAFSNSRRTPWVFIVSLIAVNAALGATRAFAISAAVLVLTWICAWGLSRPRIRANPLLAFVAHTVLALLYVIYALALFGADFGWEQLLPIMGWIIAVVWFVETARAVSWTDVSADTDDDRHNAVPLWSALLSMSAAIGLFMLGLGFEQTWAYPIIFAFIGGVGVIVSVRARLRISARAGLPQAMLAVHFAIFVGVAAGLALGNGVSWMAGMPWESI